MGIVWYIKPCWQERRGERPIQLFLFSMRIGHLFYLSVSSFSLLSPLSTWTMFHSESGDSINSSACPSEGLKGYLWRWQFYCCFRSLLNICKWRGFGWDSITHRIIYYSTTNASPVVACGGVILLRNLVKDNLIRNPSCNSKADDAMELFNK